MRTSTYFGDINRPAGPARNSYAASPLPITTLLLPGLLALPLERHAIG